MDTPDVKAGEQLALKFGERVRQVRLQKGITSQEYLAELSGLHRTFIGRVERGETNITLENIRKIAAGLGISLAELFEPFKDVLDG